MAPLVSLGGLLLIAMWLAACQEAIPDPAGPIVPPPATASPAVPASPPSAASPNSTPLQAGSTVTTAQSTPSATLVVPPAAATPTPADPYAEERQVMVERQIKARGVVDQTVLAAMSRVPRHEFVPAEFQTQAYDDHPLPIGYGQTISQPFIVALMTEMIELQPGERVLEIGTGSGYQAAILAAVTDEVYTIEIIPELAEQAQATFDRLGYDRIRAKQADGYWGWEEAGPFEAIIVTAAPDHVPQPLVNQLADGGKMVIPIGPPGGYQSLWLIERRGDQILRYNWGGVRFVPFTRE
ncbi:MAG: protein-L-isoaspartate(D-aspartate) O-methyltransferase [Anaerolineae bacterium]|nr:protein-L-isoaspartate(D-aspartate) O-methyltransferase [Anaerolineae bacterium]